MTHLPLCLVAALLATTAHASPPGENAEARRVRAAADGVRDAIAQIHAIPGSFPAVAIVVVHGDDTPLMYVEGTAHVGEPGKVDPRSRFYIASQTKSFMALLGAHLDETGVLPLDTTLAQVWPQLVLPAPADPATITMADLLSHQEGLRTDTLNFLTAYVRAVPSRDYPALLAKYTTTPDPGFRYANLG